MAAIAPTITSIGENGDDTIRIVWTPVTENDTCNPVYFPDHPIKSIQALGTFGSATVAVQGSNDGGTTFAALHSVGVTAIAITSAGVNPIVENTEQIKPVMTGGSSQSLTLALVVHRTNRP